MADNREILVRVQVEGPNLSGCSSAWSEYLPWKQGAVGSNPTTQTKFMVAVAQMVVRRFVTAVVVGSSPIGHPKLCDIRLVVKDATLSRWRARVRIPYVAPSYGALAHQGEYLFCNQEVVGSSPTGSTKLCPISSAGEQGCYIPRVGGSNPSSGTSYGMAEHG